MIKYLLFLLIPILCFGQSVYFDGDDYASEVVANYGGSNQRGTIVIWAKINTLGDEDVFFSVANISGSSYYLYVSQFNVAGTRYVKIETDDPTTKAVRGSTALVADTWYHIVVMSNSSAWKIFVNGSEDAITVVTSSNSGDWFGDFNQHDNICFGAKVGTSVTLQNDVYIDEVAVFSDTLTNAQVTTYYNNGNQYNLINESNLMNYWQMNEGSGTVIGDSKDSNPLDFAAATEDPSWSTDTIAGGLKNLFSGWPEWNIYPE